MPATGQIPIYPMTTRDEITLRTPDALLNGEGMVSVMKSCCPNILDPWKMPSVDVDSILIAIRMASYGTDMEVNSSCPSCNTTSNHTLDLNDIVPRIKMPDYNNTIEADSLKIRLKPQPYAEVNKNSMIMFEENKILQAISEPDVSEEVRMERFNQHLAKLVDLNVDSLAASTEYIETPDGEHVVDLAYIRDFYNNCQTKTIKAIRAKLDELSKEAELPKVNVQCDSCENVYEMPVEFNYSSFFDQGS